MSARLPYTRWERDRGGKLVLRQATYRVVGRPHTLERGLALRDAAVATIASALWFFAVLCIVVSALGCASADGTYDSPPESAPSPEAQPDSLPATVEVELAKAVPLQRNWCCDAVRGGKRALTCGLSERPDDVTTCYCSGTVSADTETCRDESAWTPGTFCTQGYLLCFEEE